MTRSHLLSGIFSPCSIVLKPKPKPAEEPQKKQYKKMSKDTGEKKPRFVIKARKRSIEDHSNETDDSEEDGESGDEFDADAQPHRRYAKYCSQLPPRNGYRDRKGWVSCW